MPFSLYHTTHKKAIEKMYLYLRKSFITKDFMDEEALLNLMPRCILTIHRTSE